MTAAAPAPSAPSVPAADLPKAGRLRDSGSVRRASVRAADWSTNGTAKVQGDVEVGTGTTIGLATIGGKLSADAFRASGTFEVVGPVEVRDTLRLDGTVHLQSVVHAGAVDFRGTLRSGGGLRVDRVLSATGSIEAPWAEVGLLDLTGTATIPGELRGLAAVRARFRGDSSIGSIRAKRVVLVGPPTALIPKLMRTVFGGSGLVRVGRIEAESVEVSAVTVEFVRGNQVTLGPGSHVREVEGTIVRRHPSSRLGPESWSRPPHGLSR